MVIIITLLFYFTTSSIYLTSSALVRPCSGLPPYSAHVRSIHISYYSCVCCILLFYPHFSHAQGILCGMNTSLMGSPFPIVHAKWFFFFGLLEQLCID